MLPTFFRLLLAIEGVNIVISLDEPIAHKRVPRLVGGDLTEIYRIPFLVNIRRNEYFGCGGTLITPTCLVTAAHCVYYGKPEEFQVRAGITYLDDDDAYVHKVERIFIPDDFTLKSMNNDVAVLQLTNEIRGENIRPLKLSRIKHYLRVGDAVAVYGWGLTHENGLRPSNQIRTIKVRVIPQAYCKELYKDYRNVTELMFCAADAVWGRDACLGDSGGPVIHNGELVGVVSWGKGTECGRLSSPGVYTDINQVKSWLKGIEQQYCY